MSPIWSIILGGGGALLGWFFADTVIKTRSKIIQLLIAVAFAVAALSWLPGLLNIR